MPGARLFTTIINDGESFVISNATDSPTANCLSASYLMSSASGDSGTLLGDMVLPAPIGASEAIPIPAGAGNTLFAPDNKPWTGVTIHCVQGTIMIQLAF